jgi:hypothetical protein
MVIEGLTPDEGAEFLAVLDLTIAGRPSAAGRRLR